MNSFEKPQETLKSLTETLCWLYSSDGWKDKPVWFKDKNGELHPVSTIGMTICADCPDDTPEEYKAPVGFTLQEATNDLP
ncbi:MAG: hypothetical protein FMNOHCHN_03408 [Ignavibacteriaceae bacterium]|nr:hypothetical protein [Ignavibacteriaceae bacterium]